MYVHHFWSFTMHPCTDSCDISFVLCTWNDVYVYWSQIRGVLLYSACIQMFAYKSFWCIDFHAKQCGKVCEHCNHDNQSSQMLLAHPRIRLQSSPLGSVYSIMLLILLSITFLEWNGCCWHGNLPKCHCVSVKDSISFQKGYQEFSSGEKNNNMIK